MPLKISPAPSAPGAASIRARATKQDRSTQRRRRIVDAAIAVIAEHGIAGVTHRLVARRAGVSLAATTYYYETKADIIADASAQLLAGYTDAFRRFAERHRDDLSISFHDFAMKLVTNAAGRHRADTLAWCEIILDAARHPDTRALARTWFANLEDLWFDIARSRGVASPHEVAASAIDIVIGLLFFVVPLGLSEAQVSAALSGRDDPRKNWRPAIETPTGDAPTARAGRKAEETRERILAAAMGILVAEGPAALTYRSVAAAAGLTPAAPTYHFPSIEALLGATQARLFDSSKDRYRQIMSGVDYRALDIERLTDLTATIFLREATEYGAVSTASYPIWLEAARHPSLRAMVWVMIDDLNRGWSRVLGELTHRDQTLGALFMQCLFIGKLVRILATGAATADLMNVRAEFARDLRAIGDGSHWASLSP